jgi:hypothetical protein
MFTIEYKGNSIELNKVYAFSFLRFAFSIAQRNWFRKLEKPKKKEAVVCEGNQPLNPVTKDGEQFPLFKDIPVKAEPKRESCEERLKTRYSLDKF